jgi:3-oxoacyl-[acyl-carrier protein] reductase
MVLDFADKTVLVTGGTKGIGLATALGFARFGAQCFLTCKWNSVDERSVRARFTALPCEPPTVITADVASEADTGRVMKTILDQAGRLDIFVSNAAFTGLVGDVGAYRRRDFLRSIEYTTWPLIDYVVQAAEIFGVPPRYVVGLSTIGIDNYQRNYDYAATAKACLETLARYLSFRLRAKTRVNIVRTRYVRTDSLRATLGDEFEPFVESLNLDDQFVSADDVASVVVALCSGLMDAVTGQTILVDHGATFADGVMRLYDVHQDNRPADPPPAEAEHE